MAGERRIVTRVAFDTSDVVKGAQAGRAALSSFADVSKTSTSALEREYRRLVSAISPAEKSQLAFARAVSVTNELVKKGRLTQEQANATLREAEQLYKRQASEVSGLGSIFQKFGTQLVAAFGAYQLLNIGKQAISEATEAAAAHALLANRVRETGGAAGFTADQIDQMATSLSGQLAIDNDLIKVQAGLLLQYKGITGEQFPRAIALAIDMASEQGKLVTSTEQLAGKTELLGKMLANPERAEKLLARSGKALNEEQHNLIKSFLRQNDLIGAQKVLFAELERQYGGNAKSLRSEVGGALQAVEVGWNNLLEELGKGLLFDVTGVNDLTEAINDPEALRAAHELGQALGEIASGLLKITSYNDELNTFLGKIRDLQDGWADFWRDANLPMWRPPASFPLQPPAEAPGRGGGGAAGAGQPAPTPRTGTRPAAPFDPAGAERARREAEAAQKRAEKLRETFAEILAEHELIRKKQAELLTLYSREGLTAKQRKDGEEAINDRYADRVTHTKALKQFEELGLAQAREMAAELERLTREERERNKVIEARQLFYRNAAEMIERANREAADRVEALWNRALDNIAKGVEPIRRAFAELKDLNNALDFERQSAAVSAPTAQLAAVERDYLAFLARVGEGSVAAGEKAVAQLSAVIGVSVDDIKAKWGELADLQAIGSIRGAGATPAERYRAETAELDRLRQVAADKGLDMERDFEAKRLQLSMDFWDAQLSAWSGALDFLAGAFGGIFADLQRLVSSYQQGSQAGAGIGQALGGAQGAAAGGVAGGIVGIWVAAWQWFETQGAKRRAESYGSAATVSMSGGDWNEHFTQLDGAQRRATAQIEATIDEFARALGGAFSSFADLEIQVRRDGQFFHAFVEGVFVGSFKDMQSAAEAAILAAFSNPETMLRGVSDLVRQGFEEAVARGVQGLSLDELQGYLGSLREISELGWDDASRQIRESARHFDELWDALLRLDAASAAAREGAENLIAAEADVYRARIRQLTGQQESPEEQLARLRREGELMEAQLRMRIADLRLREIELKNEAELLRARGQLAGAGGRLRQTEIESEAGYLKARGKLAEAEVNLNQAHLDAIAASLEAIGKLIAELERIDAEFDPGNIQLPRAGRGSGGVDAVRQSLADMIAESRRAIAAADQSSYRQQLDDIKRRWDEAIKAAQVPDNALERARRARDEAIKAANGNAEAIKRANEQYERQTRNIARGREEMDAANRQREAEIALLQRQQREAARRATQDYVVGSNPFAAERQRAADVKAQWKDLLDTGAIKWRQYKTEIDRVNRALEEHLQLIALQESSSLFGGLAALLDQAGLGESADALALIRAQQQANFALQLAEANLRYTQLVAEGVLIGANKDLVEDALRRLNGLDISGLFGPPPPPPDTRRFRGYEDAGSAGGSSGTSPLEEANRLRERYASAQEDPFARRLREINDEFQIIFERLGRGAENLELFRQTVEDAFDDLREPVQDWLDQLNFGDQAALTAQQRYDAELAQMAALEARIAAGDMTAYRQLGTEGNELLAAAAAAFGTAGDDYQGLLDRLRAFASQSLTMINASAANFVATGNPTPGNLLAMPLQPLGSGEVVNAIVAGNASTRDSLAVLRDIRRTSEAQSSSIGNMARDIADLRAANQALASELAMLRNSRAS